MLPAMRSQGSLYGCMPRDVHPAVVQGCLHSAGAVPSGLQVNPNPTGVMGSAFLSAEEAVVVHPSRVASLALHAWCALVQACKCAGANV